MTDLTRLDKIDARLEAATPGPWEAYGTTVAAMTGPGECGGCSGLPSPAHEPACLWSEIAGAGELDADLIAHAPTDLAALLGVVRGVAALHRPGLLTGMCITCRRNQPWPCPTARALEALTDTTEGHEGGEGA